MKSIDLTMREECDSKNCDASVEILGRLLLLKNNIEKIIYGVSLSMVEKC